MSIFEKRAAFKPFEYPEVIKFVDAINHSYWLHSEWNFISDIQDFNTRLSEKEKNAIKNALLAISQIEVSVKSFWGKVGDKIPKPEFNAVGATFAECHAEGTELLTPNGWVDFRDISIGQDVIQYNSNGSLETTIVQNVTNQYYSGNMIRLYKDNLECLITPNHRMVYFDNNDKYTAKTINELGVKNSNNKLPEAGKLVGHIDHLSYEDRLRIAIQADGSFRFYNKNGKIEYRGLSKDKITYEISVKKERKKERLQYLLDNNSFVYREYNDNRGYMKIEVDMDKNYNYKTFEWVNLLDKSSIWCEEFIQELCNWDGYRLEGKKDCKLKYSTTSKECADMVQAIGTCAGYKVNMIKSVDKRKESYNDVYILSFLSNRQKVSFSALKLENIEYSGNVYCVTVPSGAIVTRYKNKTLISGNSEVRHERAYSHLLEVLDLNHDFEVLLQNPVIQGRVDYLTKYLKGAADNSKEAYTLALTLFSLFIENVSLFSQFLLIKSFNKYRNILKDIDNVVQATQQEETLHAKFGAFIVNQIKEEYPEWFDEEFYAKIKRACLKAFDAESKIIDWIFEQGDLDFISANDLKEFIKDRFNKSLDMIGCERIFEVNEDNMNKFLWFYEEINSTANIDFFNKKSVNYSKKLQPITAEDLF